MTATPESAQGTIIVPQWLIRSAHETPSQHMAVRVVDTTITEVSSAAALLAAYPNDSVVRRDNHVLLPGYVNAHVHLYGVLAHGIPVDPVENFWSFLSDYWWPKVEDRLDATMIRAATDWVCAEMLRSGTTSFYDILEAPHAIGDALSVEREVVSRHGIRGVLSFEATERVSKANGQEGLNENRRFIEACRSANDDLISGLMCFHTTFTCSPEFIRQAFEEATSLGVLCHAHCNEGVHEGEWAETNFGMRTLEFYDSLGLLSPRFLASQCVQVTDRELALIASSGMKVSHMPLANCEVGGGIAPIPEMLSAGVTVGLGSDGYINDMAEVMRGAFLLHKARTRDPGAMPGATVLEMATDGGARAIGLNDVGRITPGWKADLQLIDARFPTPATAHNLIDQLILWRNASHVSDVMVNGSWRVRNHEVRDVDIEQMRARVHEQAMRLWERS
jgi:5-methylthioadenosine/S-adenosylhomocysteine deaminase